MTTETTFVILHELGWRKRIAKAVGSTEPESPAATPSWARAQRGAMPKPAAPAKPPATPAPAASPTPAPSSSPTVSPERSWRVVGVQHHLGTGLVTHLHQEFAGGKATGNFATTGFQSNGRKVAQYKTRMFSSKDIPSVREKFRNIHQEHATSAVARSIAGGGIPSVGGPIHRVVDYRQVPQSQQGLLSAVHTAHKQAVVAAPAMASVVQRAQDWQYRTPENTSEKLTMPGNSEKLTRYSGIHTSGGRLIGRDQGMLFAAHNRGTNEYVHVHAHPEGGYSVHHFQTVTSSGHVATHGHQAFGDREEALQHAASLVNTGLGGKTARSLYSGYHTHGTLKQLQKKGKLQGFVRPGLPKVDAKAVGVADRLREEHNTAVAAARERWNARKEAAGGDLHQMAFSPATPGPRGE